MYWCFTSHATIFQLYMWWHRCAGGLKKKLYLRSGSQCHRHFAGFFNVPVQVPTRGQPFYGYSEKLPHLVAFYDMLGMQRTYSQLNFPGIPMGMNIGEIVMEPCICTLELTVIKWNCCVQATWIEVQDQIWHSPAMKHTETGIYFPMKDTDHANENWHWFFWLFRGFSSL